MNLFQTILYGIISGLSEFIPVSSNGHRFLLLELFGIKDTDPLLDIMIHAALLLAVITNCRGLLEQLRCSTHHYARKARSRNQSNYSNLDLKFISTAAVALIIGLFVLTYVNINTYSLLLVAIFFLINGIILFIPSRMLQGNKDARSMSALDSILTGVLGAFSAFPGISRMACCTTLPLAKGAGQRHALNWALIISIPALAALILFDVFKLFAAANTVILSAFPIYILAMIGAYIGGYFSIIIMKFLVIRTGFSGLSYYSWGAALFSFILYLI